MSTTSGRSTTVNLFPGVARSTAGSQSNSCLTPVVRILLRWVDRTRQRRALRAIAENEHLLDDFDCLGVRRLAKPTALSDND